MTSKLVAQRADCPSVEELGRLLDPLIEPSTVLTAHLETCSYCQELLHGMAGDQQHWTDVAASLQDTQYINHRHQATLRIVNSVCAMSSDRELVQDTLREHEEEQLKNLLEPASHPELLGRLGRYEFEQLIGRGGMGLVFRAYDTELHRVVAVKTLALHLVSLGSARERFIREGRAGASLVHPHVVSIHDVVTEGPVPALVMQFVAGPTLEDWLRIRGPLPWRQATDLMLQLLSGLSAAHNKGFVHRDIKPGNVLLEAEASRALLTDFGLVRALDDASLTHSGMLAGTPDYMSPEQASGASVECTSDLFSMGSLFYSMLAGHPPFRANSPMAVLNRICHEPHRPVAESCPDIPVEVSAFVDRLLNKQPKGRFDSAFDAREALQRIQQSPITLSPNKRKFRTSTGQRLAVLAGLLLACLGVAFSVSAVRHQPDRQSPNPRRLQDEATEQAALDSIAIGSEQGVNDFVVLQQIDREIVRLNRRVDSLLQQRDQSQVENQSRFQESGFADVPASNLLKQVTGFAERLKRDEVGTLLRTSRP